MSRGLPHGPWPTHSAVADLAPLLDGVGCPDLPQAPSRAEVVILDGTGMRASPRRLGVTCNIALGLTGRTGPRRRRQVHTALLGLTLAQPWSAMAEQLRTLDPPVVVVVDGEPAVTALAEAVWPEVPIQRCWWHLPRALRWALYADRAPHPWASAERADLIALLHRVAGQRLTHAQALAAYGTFTAGVTAEGHHPAG